MLTWECSGEICNVFLRNKTLFHLLTKTSYLLFFSFLESNEFILYAVRSSIHRYDLATGTDQPLPLSGLHEAVALDFDYEKNCLYWADISLDTIQVNKRPSLT